MGKRIERWPLDSLKKNERQDANFHDLDDPELDRLADDMKSNLQTTPIEILPNGSVIDGHQRLRAAKLLHWTEVKVWVGDDLKSKRAVEARMLQANEARRQLDTLDRVRVAIRTCELQHRCRPGELDSYRLQRLTGQLSETLRMGKRNVRRWLSVARAPMVVQLAVKKGDLNLVVAEKVARMDTARQDRIAEAIDRGEDPNTLVREELRATPIVKATDPSREFSKFIDSIGLRLNALETTVPAIERGSNSEQDLELIARLEAFLKSVKPVLRKQARRSRQEIASYAKMAADMRQRFTRGSVLCCRR